MSRVASLLIGVGLVACATTKKAEREPAPAPKPVAVSQDQFEANRLAYVLHAQERIADLDAKIAVYRARAPDDPTVRESYMNTVAALQDNVEEAKRDLIDARAATPESWDSQQRRIEQSLLTAQSAYDAAVNV